MEPGQMGDTGVLLKAAWNGMSCIIFGQKREISSYFPVVIAVAQNNLLFSGSCRLQRS
jgi:hypothetical protein